MNNIFFRPLCLTLVSTALLATTALAMPGMEGKAPGKTAGKITGSSNQITEKYTKMDGNGDGSVSAEEFKAAYPQMTDAVFGIIDKDNKGGISLEEWMLFQKDHMQGMKEEHAPPAKNSNLIITPPKKD